MVDAKPWAKRDAERAAERARQRATLTCHNCAAHIPNAKHSNRRLCDDCQLLRKVARDRAYNVKRPQRAVVSKVCERCQTSFDGTADPRERYCSEDCRRQVWDEHRATDPASRARKRLRMRRILARRRAQARATSTGDYSPAEVFAADGWRCRICHRTVSDELPNSHPRKVHLGHIVALAAGGTDTRENVCCLCRQCNLRDGTGRLPIQLAIV